ncbi:Slx9p TDEL_0C05460 [Torulaspora delbrueckii]|uniref:Ribosome biogenesis protein SLX9 n=1 Tax=Torulaspora delbrueckii TaxID=4950 RepID=G8ZSE3_TORDE|nr:hypothetical protein TDEL_0C05460 [Torulaspora delbrueckii]CCE91435.1 hypothetical protein TDEL_0C05460 [Torulaspora delbrueckii]
MVAKRRTTLRNKAAAAAVASNANNEDVENIVVETSPRPFLHQPRESKKDKQNNKQQNFLNRVLAKATGQDQFAGISKSAVRRRKRKLREDLKPKMGDLLTSLGQEDDLKEHVQEEIVDEKVQVEEPRRNVTKIVSIKNQDHADPGFVKIRKNEPNIRNQKGAKVLSIRETTRMNNVLHNASFQQNPFGALRDVIKMQQDGS